MLLEAFGHGAVARAADGQGRQGGGASKEKSRDQREAVEVATLAAKTTEMRMSAELRSAAADAVVEARVTARAAQEKAAEAIRVTEQRCREQQRVAVANVTEMHSALPLTRRLPPECRLQPEAANAAAAAVAASMSLLGRDRGHGRADERGGCGGRPRADEGGEKQPLQFF